MIIKNSQITPLLLQIASFDAETKQPISGLLFENIKLSVKRRLQKIRKELLIADQALQADLLEAKADENPEKEVKDLLEEVVNLSCDYVPMAEIEAIQTEKNYDFDLIELIAE